MTAAESRSSELSVTAEPHAANPRLRVVLRGRVNGHEVADAFIRLYAEQPEAVFHDRLFDLTGYRSGFELPHLQRIQAAYAALAVGPGRPCRTAFVTLDANFRLWVASMGYQFAGREFRAFETFEEAERFLDVPLAERTRSASG